MLCGYINFCYFTADDLTDIHCVCALKSLSSFLVPKTLLHWFLHQQINLIWNVYFVTFQSINHGQLHSHVIHGKHLLQMTKNLSQLSQCLGNSLSYNTMQLLLKLLEGVSKEYNYQKKLFGFGKRNF